MALPEPPELPELPSGWSEPEVFVERVAIGDLFVSLAGLSTKHVTGAIATGSAAAIGDPPLDRAGFELCERVAVIQQTLFDELVPLRSPSGRREGLLSRDDVFPRAPQGSSFTYSLSNGVALHRDWPTACERARFEALERDAILRSWLGGPPPSSYRPPRSAFLRELERHYELRAVWFDACDSAHVTAMFGFPKAARIPLLMSFGAGADADTSWQRCEAEALQRVGFLWGEPIPTEQPLLAGDAVSQQEFYLWPGSHGFLRVWLDGGHARPASDLPSTASSIVFADLTPSSYQRTLVVAKALDSNFVPLVFGEGHPLVSKPRPSSMRVQPIA